jgi:hypothetical protein
MTTLEARTGSRSCYVNGCDHPECEAENRAYQRETYRLSRRGKPVRQVDYVTPEATREHIANLRAQGMGCPAIARLAGVRDDTVLRIALGYPKKIVSTTAERILAVPLRKEWVDPTGTTRRIQALCARGHSLTTIGQVAGIAPRHLSDITAGRVMTVRRSTHEHVAAAFEKLAMQPGVSDQTRKRSLAKGWVPPLAWDEDAIDDPDATPYGIREKDTPTLDLDDWWYLVRCGENPARAAERCGVTLSAVERMAHRHGRPEIASIAGSARKRWSAA